MTSTLSGLLRSLLSRLSLSSVCNVSFFIWLIFNFIAVFHQFFFYHVPWCYFMIFLLVITSSNHFSAFPFSSSPSGTEIPKMLDCFMLSHSSPNPVHLFSVFLCLCAVSFGTVSVAMTSTLLTFSSSLSKLLLISSSVCFVWLLEVSLARFIASVYFLHILIFSFAFLSIYLRFIIAIQGRCLLLLL